MTDANGWPNEPGVPINPERTRQHWFRDPARPKDGPHQVWWFAEGQTRWWDRPVEQMGWQYMGMVLLPAEVAAREAAAAEAMRSVCARAAMVELGWNNGSVEARKAIALQAAHTVNAIRERPIPAPDALARLIAEAEARGMEAALVVAQAVHDRAASCAREPDLIANIRREYLAQSRGAEDVIDAIRAAAKERTA